MRSIATLTIAAAATTLSAHASAALISISGGGIIYPNPDPNLPQSNQLESTVVQGFDELQGLILGTDISIDDLADIIGAITLPAGSSVSSHFLKFDPTNATSVSNIQIIFDAEVLAVITTDNRLADTHALFGRPGMNYPGQIFQYGFEASTENFSVSGNTVTFSGSASTPGDHFRVITAIPAPTTALTLAAAPLLTRRRRA